MDWGTAIMWIIIVVLGTIITQYLFNPFLNKLGLPKTRDEETPREKTEEERKKEEEFYRQIWTAKKRKRNL